MSNCVKSFFSIIGFILITFIVGPLLGPYYYYPSIKSNSDSTILTSYGSIIAVSVGLIDSALYGIGFYLSTQAINDFDHPRLSSDRHEDLQSMIVQEKQLLQPISETIDLLIRTQVDLYDFLNDISNDKTIDEVLIKNSRNKLATFEFIHNDSLMTIKHLIHERFQVLSFIRHQKSMQIYSNHSRPADADLFNRVYLYIFTCSFLLYLHQLALYVIQYLSLKNPVKYLSYLCILSVVILSQSLGLIYFLQITDTFHSLSPLCIYACVFFLRSLVSIYHSSFSVD